MNFDRTRAMEVFARVVELQSFTAAASALGMSQPAVTKSVKSLEEHLGAQLLNRSTRRLSLTDDGQLFYEDTRRILEALDEAEGRLGKRSGAPTGLLRVACSIAFGRLVLLEAVRAFLSDNPLVQIELVMEDRRVDLIEQGVDVAIRVGELADSTLRAARIGSSIRGTYASPRYLERAGTPQRPRDLRNHNCIVFTGLSTRDEWVYEGPDGGETVLVGGNFLCSNSDGCRSAVIEGVGIGYHPEWLFSDALASGDVVRLLTRYAPPPLPLHAVFPAGRYVNTKTRRFVDALKAHVGRDPCLRS